MSAVIEVCPLLSRCVRYYRGVSADYRGVSADYRGVSADYRGVSADYRGVSAIIEVCPLL